MRSRPEERKIRGMMVEEAEKLRRGSSLGLLWMAEAEARGLQLAEEEPDYGELTPFSAGLDLIGQNEPKCGMRNFETLPNR